MNANFDSQSSMRVAEFVLPGHPDKIADAIADSIVDAARTRDPRALVAAEVAVHCNVVFIDGRVAGKSAPEIDFRELARNVYRSAGYGQGFEPVPNRVKVITDLCVEEQPPEESESREISDDQSITIGYCTSLAGTGGLPPEHALVRRLALAVHSVRLDHPELLLGPDAKVVVFVQESKDGRRLRLSDCSISLHHSQAWDAVLAVRKVESRIHAELQRFAVAVPGFEVDDGGVSIYTGGDFIIGGPFGDNGLSGKKLVADFYGPRVPIGGGAMSGKDFWKVDRAGPLIARDLAQAAVQRMGCRECTVTLGIRPGDREFRIVRIEAENKQPLDIAKLRNLTDLRLCSRSDWPDAAGDLVEVARWGHFAPIPTRTPTQTSGFKARIKP